MSHFSQGHCPACDKKVLAVKTPVNHILHAIISFVSCGMWLFIWVIAVLLSDASPWRCHD